MPLDVSVFYILSFIFDLSPFMYFFFRFFVFWGRRKFHFYFEKLSPDWYMEMLSLPFLFDLISFIWKPCLIKTMIKKKRLITLVILISVTTALNSTILNTEFQDEHFLSSCASPYTPLIINELKCAGGVIYNVSAMEIGESSSNSSRLRYTSLHANTLENATDLHFSPLAMI